MADSKTGKETYKISPEHVAIPGLPFPSPGDLLDPGIEPMSLMSPVLAGTRILYHYHHHIYIHIYVYISLIYIHLPSLSAGMA